jgi:hypothetical protein
MVKSSARSTHEYMEGFINMMTIDEMNEKWKNIVTNQRMRFFFEYGHSLTRFLQGGTLESIELATYTGCGKYDWEIQVNFKGKCYTFYSVYGIKLTQKESLLTEREEYDFLDFLEDYMSLTRYIRKKKVGMNNGTNETR